MVEMCSLITDCNHRTMYSKHCDCVTLVKWTLLHASWWWRTQRANHSALNCIHSCKCDGRRTVEPAESRAVRCLIWPHHAQMPCVGRGTPLSPLVHLLPHLLPFLHSPFFHWLYLFLLLSIPSLSTRIVPLHFQAGGCRKRPNRGLVCCV